jgi:hypothetical protein
MAWISFPVGRGVRVGTTFGRRNDGTILILIIIALVALFYIGLAAGTIACILYGIIALKQGNFLKAGALACLAL